MSLSTFHFHCEITWSLGFTMILYFSSQCSFYITFALELCRACLIQLKSWHIFFLQVTRFWFEEKCSKWRAVGHLASLPFGFIVVLFNFIQTPSSTVFLFCLVMCRPADLVFHPRFSCFLTAKIWTGPWMKFHHINKYINILVLTCLYLLYLMDNCFGSRLEDNKAEFWFVVCVYLFINTIIFPI